MKKILLSLLIVSGYAFSQSAGVGQNWTFLGPTTLQSAATGNGNGTAMAVAGLSSVIFNANCVVTCGGGTTINFEGSSDGTNFAPISVVQIGTSTIATTVTNQASGSVTLWQGPVGAFQTIRARISAYSAGTVTVTATASAAGYDPKVLNANLVAGSAVIGHTINDTGSTTAVTGNVASTIADGADVVLGAKADAKNVATDTTSISLMSVLKEISAMEQAPASRAVTNVGTFAVQSTNAAETTKVLGTVRNVGNVGAAFDAATGAAPPANGVLMAGVTSGATGGFLTGIPVCDSFFNVNIVTATTTLVVTGVSGRHVRICSINLVASAADNVGVISGTGATCGTGSAAIVGTTSATGWNLGPNGGLSQGAGIGVIMRTVATGDSVCFITSTTAQLSGVIAYTIY